MHVQHSNFPWIREELRRLLLRHAPVVDVGEWHSKDVSERPELVTRELVHVSFTMEVPETAKELAELTEPQMPWAEEHFEERVCGEPLNPPPSAQRWHSSGVVDKHLIDTKEGWAVTDPEVGWDVIDDPIKKYSHTYPERFWPRQIMGPGIRFEPGQLPDVVNLLKRQQLTRQAYLPVWFPEDTGAVHGERVPCSLGYHFMIRRDQVFCMYPIRSVDFMRHFRDDVYLACRLQQWIREQVDSSLLMGYMTMMIGSLHCMEGDIPIMKKEKHVRGN